VAIDWATIASLATAGGTLLLAVSTFASVRSANKTARATQKSLLIGLRPLMVPSRPEDGPQKVMFADGKHVLLQGGGAAVEVDGDVIYLAMSVRNAGSGIGVVWAWRVRPGRDFSDPPPSVASFRQHIRSIFIAASDVGFWEAAFRDPADPEHQQALAAIEAGQSLTVDVLYGDNQGGQRMVTRFHLLAQDGQWLTWASRHWNLPDPGWSVLDALRSRARPGAGHPRRAGG
jgi:hypothetical protein